MRNQTLTRCGLFTALLAVCAWIGVPFGDRVITMQTLGMFLALGLLGGRLGSIVCLLYLMMGAAGVPVFAGFRGGLGALLGPTGGYLWGFLAGALVYWLLTEKFCCKQLPAMVLTLPVCYLCGTVWYLAYAGGGLLPVLVSCVVPYLLPDVLKLLLARILIQKLRRFLRIMPPSGA